MNRISWLKAALIFAAIWIVAGGAIYWARAMKATPESVARYVETHSLDGRGTTDRQKIIDKVADQMNALSYEDRRQIRIGRGPDRFLKKLTPEEQSRFLDRTLPTGFKQMMDSLNRMDPAERKRFVGRALRDMERDGGRPPDAKLDANAKKVMDEGFKSFYSEANADVKMDMAPLIEQLQKSLQGFR